MTQAQARASLIAQAQERWDKARGAYEHAPHDFYTSWCYLCAHPIFQDPDTHSLFQVELFIQVVKVNPATGEIDDDESKNARVEVWVEHGPLWRKDDAPPDFWSNDLREHTAFDYVHTHDPDLDTGGETFEHAIVALAHLVREEYGDDRSRVYLSDAEKHPERHAG